jgi:predicted dehydrogenase
MPSTLRCAMLGCGAVADLYLPVFRSLERARLLAVIDIDRGRAREMAEKYAVNRVYDSVQEAACDREIDAVIVGTPPNVHAEHIELLARAGKHILCEKPMASSVEDCQRIIDACRASKVTLQMGHMKRFMRGNQKVKALIDSGALGTVFMAECHWDCAVPQLVGTYREEAVTVGGSLQDHGPHAFDLIRWWTGNDVLRVSATVRSVHPGRPTEDAAVVVLEHAGGMFSYHHMTRISYGREHTQDTYRIYGTEGTLVVRNDHHFPTMSLESPEIILYRPGELVQRFASPFWRGSRRASPGKTANTSSSVSSPPTSPQPGARRSSCPCTRPPISRCCSGSSRSGISGILGSSRSVPHGVWPTSTSPITYSATGHRGVASGGRMPSTECAGRQNLTGFREGSSVDPDQCRKPQDEVSWQSSRV